jgi:hypothetical protein
LGAINEPGVIAELKYNYDTHSAARLVALHGYPAPNLLYYPAAMLYLTSMLTSTATATAMVCFSLYR